MLKREWGAESNRRLQQLLIPSKTASLVPEFAVEDLPLDRTATLVRAFTVIDLPLGRILMMMMIIIIIHIRERRVIGISGSLIWSKTLMELIYLTPVVNLGEVRRAS